MNHRTIVCVILILTAAAFLASSAASAQTGGPYRQTRYTVDSGGGQLTGGSYVLLGTAGQPEAGGPLSGGGYTLEGGLWGSGAGAVYEVYLPLVMCSAP